MGYFSNGSEGDAYEHAFCIHCVHAGTVSGCPIMLAHVVHNYDECSKEDSILHMLIPRDKDGHNEQCLMFLESAKLHRGIVPDHLKEWAKKQGLIEVKQ